VLDGAFQGCGEGSHEGNSRIAERQRALVPLTGRCGAPARSRGARRLGAFTRADRSVGAGAWVQVV